MLGSLLLDSKRRDVRAVTVVVATAVAGCAPAVQGPTSPVGHLSIWNVDGPQIEVRVAGRVAGEVACGSQTDLDVAGAAGPLPWHIEFIGPGGATFATVDESVQSFHGYAAIRSDGVVLGDAPVIGPVASACPQ